VPPLSALPSGGALPSAAESNCLVRNEWICGEYLSSRASILGEALFEHVWITLVSVLLGLALALPLALVARRYRRLVFFVVASTTAIYTGVSGDYKNRVLRQALDRIYDSQPPVEKGELR